MKSLILSLFAVALLATAVPASADWGRGPGPGGPGPGWNGPDHDRRPPPNWGRSCKVIYDVCKFAINGFCVKWNNKSFDMRCREAYDHGCWEAQRREGQRIRNCRIAQN